MPTLPIDPEFTSGALDRQLEHLSDDKYVDNKYKGSVDIRNGVPYVPGQFMARFHDPKITLDKPSAWVQRWLKGERIDVKTIWSVGPNQKREQLKGSLTFRLLQLCRCCDTPFFLLNITPIGTDSNIAELLAGSSFISLDKDGGTSVTISPGGDGDPQGTSLDILAQNQYTFSSVPPADNTHGLVKEQKAQPANLDPSKLEANYKPLSSTPKDVRIAIIDTGFKRSLIEGAIQNRVTIWNKEGRSPCNLPNDRVGWNFIGDTTIKELIDSNAYGVDATGTIMVNKLENNNPEDNSLNEHGTLLAALITQYAQSTPTALMILKAFDSQGRGTLFSIICAFCYAQANGADIVNASFIAHYSPGTDYLNKVIGDLKRKGIIVVCAAGNRGSGTDSRGQLLTGQLFPACYSQLHHNVITTTSIWGNSQHRRQGFYATSSENYSPEYVNVGVLTNHPVRIDEGYFKAPYLWFRELIKHDEYAHVKARYSDKGVDGVVGSSFATAIVTGLVAGLISNHGGITNLVGSRSDYSGTDPQAAILSRLPHVAKTGIGLVINNVYVQA